MASEHHSAADRRRLGAELRSLREQQGLTGQQLADQIGWSQAKVSRIEGARTRAPVEDVAVLLTALEVLPASTPALLDLAAEAAGPAESWRNSSRVGLTRRQQDFINSEAAAVLIRHYEPPRRVRRRSHTRENACSVCSRDMRGHGFVTSSG